MSEYIQTFNRLYFGQMKSRDYKCPCGKSYLSYAALFTHIKQKHNGKAPGKISKPSSLNTKRGRPSLKSKYNQNQINLLLKNSHISDQNYNKQSNMQQQSQESINNISQENYQHIHDSQKQQENQQFNNMKNNNKENNNNQMLLQAEKFVQYVAKLIMELPQQDINKAHLSQIQAFTQMMVIIAKNDNNINMNNMNNIIYNNNNNNINYNNNNRKSKQSQSNQKKLISTPPKPPQPSISIGLIQFFHSICPLVSWQKFQQLYILFMIFLQYLIDQYNNKQILISSSMDIMCQNINQFYQNHLIPLAQYYQVDKISILKKNIVVEIFNGLFGWMMAKKYTNYVLKSKNWDSNKQENIKNNNVNKHIVNQIHQVQFKVENYA